MLNILLAAGALHDCLGAGVRVIGQSTEGHVHRAHLARHHAALAGRGVQRPDAAREDGGAPVIDALDVGEVAWKSNEKRGVAWHDVSLEKRRSAEAQNSMQEASLYFTHKDS